MDLKFKEKFALKIQYLIAWITIPLWGTFLIALMRFLRGYKVQQLPEIRRHYKRLRRSVAGPLIVCSNHLTMLDSLVLNWSLASIPYYTRSFKKFSWNIPERDYLDQNFILRIICYLGCCIPIDRGGSRGTVKKSLDKVIYLLKKGHTLTIFPEGARSRTGRIDLDSFTYGVGSLVNKVTDCNVLCVYLRGHNQESYSNMPPRGARFYLEMELIRPESTYSGLRATRDIASQIISKLGLMEEAYFATARQ